MRMKKRKKNWNGRVEEGHLKTKGGVSEATQCVNLTIATNKIYCPTIHGHFTIEWPTMLPRPPASALPGQVKPGK